MAHVNYTGDVPKADQEIIEEFVNREDEHPLKPLPLCSVLELPNGPQRTSCPV